MQIEEGTQNPELIVEPELECSMMPLTQQQKCVLYSRKYRNKNITNYRAYQRDYKAQRYEDPRIRSSILKNMKLKYYYSTDPTRDIRRLFFATNT